VYSYYDCCGVLQEGTTPGEIVCYDANQPNAGVIDNGFSCSISCTLTPTPTNTVTPTTTPTNTPTQTQTPTTTNNNNTPTPTNTSTTTPTPTNTSAETFFVLFENNNIMTSEDGVGIEYE